VPDEAVVADTPLVSIIVVTYGTGPIVLEALEAIARHTPVFHEVIVVDNPVTPEDHSTASPTAEILGDVAGITLITSDENLGFSGANNLGVERAIGEYVCFLNPDVIVGPGWLLPLVSALGDPVVGIAAPLLVNVDGSLQEAGQVLYDDGCTAAIGGPEVFPGDWTQAFTRDVDYASAACWLVRRTEFLELGGFDERYRPAYFEDVDYALRNEDAHRRTRLVVDAPVVHHHGDGGSGGGLAVAERSQVAFRAKWEQRLTQQPPRPATDAAALVNRDRLVERYAGWSAVAARSTVVVRRRGLDEARRIARDAPRQRAMFVTDDATDLDVDGARRDGVEVLVGDVDELIARRPGPTEWTPVTSRSARIPAALRALGSPWAALILVVGAVLRFLVIDSPTGVMNSDEAYTGLTAFGVLDGRFPIVIDGNRYTAVLETYLFAPVFAVVGPSIGALKLMPIVFWAFAAVCTYLAADRIANRRVGAVAGALVWIAPGALLVVSTLAYVGYALGMGLIVAALGVAAVLIDRDRPTIPLAAAFGALWGLAFYVHPMYLSVLVPMALPVVWFHRRHLTTFWLPFVGAGIAVNGPFLAWNAVNGFPSLEVQNGLPGSYTDRLDTFARELVPRGYGLRDISFAWVFGQTAGFIAYGVLIAAVVVGCVSLVRRSDRRSRWLVPIVVVAVWPLMALFSPLIWSADGRYNVIAFPFVAIAVASGLLAVTSADRRVLTTSALGVVAVWGAVFVWPHTSDVVTIRTLDPNAPLIELVDFLDAEGIDRISGSYWRVLTVEFASDRRILGAVSPPDPVRFPERQRIVEATAPEDIAFVFPNWADDPSKLFEPAGGYERVVVADTVVYLPIASS